MPSVKKSFVLLVLCAATVASAGGVTPPPPPPAGLAAHPRLVLTPARILEIQAYASVNGSQAAAFLEFLEIHAVWALAQPVVPHGTPGPSGILIAVRDAMDIMLTSAAAFVLLPSETPKHAAFLARAVAELMNLCVTWPDWNTVQHALDTGEALAATGLAYDWLYEALSPEQRAAAMAGIVSRGLTPFATYIPQPSVFWWVNNSINWNCVCSSGGVIGVLATWGDAGAPGPSAWTSVLQPLVASVEPCVAAYHDDGSWDEGPGYWGYASKYNVWLFSALQSTINDTSACGLKNIPGVGIASLFTLYNTGANALAGDGTADTFK